ncbi:hypothetical protein JCM10207_007262 [Rhodosporidiobolus poonsookiae]
MVANHLSSEEALTELANTVRAVVRTRLPAALQPHLAQWQALFQYAITCFNTTGSTNLRVEDRQPVIGEVRRVTALLQNGTLKYLPLPEDPVHFPVLRRALRRQVGRTVRGRHIESQATFPWRHKSAAIPWLFRGVTAVGQDKGIPSALREGWLAEWQAYVAKHHQSWTPTETSVFTGGLLDMILFVREHGEAAYHSENDPVFLAAKEIVDDRQTQRSLDKQDLRALGHRQQLIYGQSRAMGDLGANGRRSGRSF